VGTVLDLWGTSGEPRFAWLCMLCEKRGGKGGKGHLQEDAGFKARLFEEHVEVI